MLEIFLKPEQQTTSTYVHSRQVPLLDFRYVHTSNTGSVSLHIDTQVESANQSPY